MTIRVAVSAADADALRSGIYSFLSKCEARAEDRASDVFITVLPVGETREYSLDFGDVADADAFLVYLPSVLPGIKTTL